MIRYILEPLHLEIQAKYPKKTIYTSYHSIADQYVPIDEKKEVYKILKNYNFDISFHEITQKNIDNKFIKNLNHGMGISMKLLVKKELPLMLKKINHKEKINLKDKSITYPCENLVYHFSEQDQIKLEITDR